MQITVGDIFTDLSLIIKHSSRYSLFIVDQSEFVYSKILALPELSVLYLQTIAPIYDYGIE